MCATAFLNLVKACHSSQVVAGLTSASKTVDTGGGAATVEMTTLDGHSVVVHMDAGGVRITSAADECPYSRDTYDCVNSLLLNNSAGFKTWFNQSLFAALAQVQQEREQLSDFGEEDR